jgi:hypothetical protein
MRGADFLPDGNGDASRSRPAGGCVEADTGGQPSPFAAARLLSLAVDLLATLPFASELQVGIQARMSLLVMLIEFVAVMMIVAFQTLVRRFTEAVRQGNPDLSPIAEACAGLRSWRADIGRWR